MFIGGILQKNKRMAQRALEDYPAANEITILAAGRADDNLYRYVYALVPQTGNYIMTVSEVFPLKSEA